MSWGHAKVVVEVFGPALAGGISPALAALVLLDLTYRATDLEPFADNLPDYQRTEPQKTGLLEHSCS